MSSAKAKERNGGILQYWPYAAAILYLGLFYANIFLVQGAWLVADHAEQHFPWAYTLSESLKSWQIPFWTDMIHSGFPLTAEGQIGSFYLPNLLFYAFLPIQAGYAWNICFHLILSACLMLSFMKMLGIDNKGAFFGVLVYLFGSTLGGVYYNITSLKVMTWFPLALILIEGMLRSEKPKWGSIVFLGFVFSLQLLAGYLQYAALAIFFAGLYWFFRLFDSPRKNRRVILSSLAGIVLAVIMAAILAFPQIYLTFELAIQSNRAGQGEAFAYVGSYSPLALICLLFPSMEGLFALSRFLKKGMARILFISEAKNKFGPCCQK